MKDMKSDAFTMLMSWFSSVMKNMKLNVLTTLMKIIFTLNFLYSDDVLLK